MAEELHCAARKEREKIRGGSIIVPPHNFDQLVYTHRMEKLGFGVQHVVSQCDLMEVIKGKAVESKVLNELQDNC
ncbi:hypothetical protein ABVT39_010978 [Epinephelus coioides]